MTLPEKYNKIMTGIISGLILPFITAMIIFLFAKGNPGLREWFERISTADVSTQIISMCVLPNLLIFFLFNHYDMLRASRGVLGITIVWAIIVFGVKILI